MKFTRVLSFVLALVMILATLALLPWTTVFAEGSYNFALGQSITATSDYVNPEGFFNVQFLVDGEWDTYTAAGDKLGWHTNPYESIGETTPVDITLTLDGAYKLNEIILKPQKWSNGQAFPRDYLLQVSMDGIVWTTVAEGKNVDVAAANNSQVKPISYPITETQLKYFRIHITRHSTVVDVNTNAYYSGIGELELMGTYDENAPDNSVAELNKTALRMQPGEYDVLKLIRPTPNAEWSSDNPAVATVDQNGRVEAVAFGETTIRVKTAKGSAACTVLVDDYSVLDNLMITTFRSPSKPHLTPETYDLLAAAGFNNIQNEFNTSVNTIPDNLLMAQYAYERGMYITASLGAWADGFTGLSYEAVQERVSTFSHVPGVGGIYILDEPYNANPYATAYKPIKDLMPYADIHLNFLPMLVYPNAKTYSAQINDFYQLTGGRLDYLMYDHYPYNFTEGYFNEASWYENMDVVRQLGLKTGAKTGTFILSIGMRGGYRKPTGDEIRFEMYSAMAYGYKQLAYFCWETPNEIDYGFGPAIVDTEGRPTEIYEPVKEVNNEALKLGPTLMQLECVTPYNTGSKCGYDRSLPEDFFLQPSKGSQLIISHMRNPETGEDYAFIVNRERYKEQTVTLTPATYIASMKEISNQTGKPEDVERNADGTYTIILRPGAGRLFKMPDTCNYTPDFGQFIVEKGENLALDGNVRAENSVGADGFYMAYANDGERFSGRVDRGWDSTACTDQKSWVYVDMGGITDVNRVDLYPTGSETTFGEGFPTDFTIDVSTDGENWITVQTVKDCPRPTKSVPTYTFKTVQARYVRVNITGMQKISDVYRARISEIEIYNDDGTLPPPDNTPYVVPDAPLGSNMANSSDTELMFSSNHTANGFDAELIRDEKKLTAAGWSSDLHNTADATEWIGYDLGATQIVAKVTAYRVKDNAFPVSYRVETSLDGKDWRVIYEVENDQNNAVGDRDTREIILETPVEARYVRMVATKLAAETGTASYSFRLSELEVIAGERVNKEPLNSLIAGAVKLNLQIYTKESASAVASALAIAQNTVAQQKVTNAELKAAYDALSQAIAGLVLIDNIATENLALGKKVIVSSAYQEAPYWLNAGINDGRKYDVTEADGLHCGWSSNIHANPEPDGADEWIGFNLGEEYNILRMVIYPAQNGATYAQGFPTSYTIDVSENGRSWTTVLTVDDVPNADELVEHTINLGGVKTQYIRFRGTGLRAIGNGQFGYMMQLSEIEVYGYTDADAPDIPEPPVESETETETPPESTPMTPTETDPSIPSETEPETIPESDAVETQPSPLESMLPETTPDSVPSPADTAPATVPTTDPASSDAGKSKGCKALVALASLPLLAAALLLIRKREE